MKKLILALALAATAAPVMAGNFATCILDEMPGVKNTIAAVSVQRMCNQKHPGGFANVERGSGLGFFSRIKNPDECFARHGRDLRAQASTSVVMTACRQLYTKKPSAPERAGLFDDLIPQR